MAIKTQAFNENGITLSKTPIYVGDEVTVTYDGLLVRCGADKIFAYIGYGEEWEEKGFIPMNYEFDTFKATFKVLLPGSLNLAFKDSADNWDNNSGDNYVYKVSKKQKASAKAIEEESPAKAEPKVKTTKAAKKSKTTVNAQEDAVKKAAVVKPKTTRKKKEEA